MTTLTDKGAGWAPDSPGARPRTDAMNNLTRAEPIEILLVEDTPDDAYMTMEALQEGKIRNTIHHVEDGVEALRFLRRQGKYARMPRPQLILLDISLPRMDGLEVLDEIRRDPEVRHIPVVIMTRSTDRVDEAYRKYANCYVTKPLDVEQFIGVVHKIESFWLTVVTLPHAA
jgi:two-component system response regulator